LALAAASAVSISAARTRAKLDDTGLARSSVTESLLSRAAEDATSTRDGVTCLGLGTTETPPLSVQELSDELGGDDEVSPC